MQLTKRGFIVVGFAAGLLVWGIAVCASHATRPHAETELSARSAHREVAPIEGRDVIAAIFAQSSSTRGSGTYTAEFKLDERTTFLRWVGTMDGHKIESLEVIVDNEQGLIEERTIALRPYPAVKLFRDAMYASLKDKLPPDVWDYPTP